MRHLEQLRAALATSLAALDTLTAKETLTAEDIAAIEKTTAEIESLEGQIKTLDDAQKTKARVTRPADDPADNAENRENGEKPRTPAQPAERMTHNQRAGLIAMAIAQSQFERRDTGEQISPLKILEAHGFGRFATEIAEHRERHAQLIRALNASTASAGGVLVPDSLSGDIVELLRPITAFLAGNPRPVDMPNGTFRQAGAATGAQAAYRAEGSRIATTEPSFRALDMAVKFLGAIVPMTRQMIQFSLAGAQAFVESDLRAAMSQTMDLNAFFGDGTEGAPLGLINRPDIVTSVAIAGTTTATLAEIDTVSRNAQMAFLGRNIRNMDRWAWVMSPRTSLYLQSKRVGDNNGDYAYPTMQGPNPTWGGIRVLVTTQVPLNLGVGGDESYILLINFDDVYFGTQEGLMVATSNEATIFHNGEWISAFQNDLVFLRATHAHDVGLRRPESVIVIDQVRWGA